MAKTRLGMGPEGVLLMWALRLLALCLATVPVYAMGRLIMYGLLSTRQYEQVLIAGHFYSVWLGGWALLACAGFVVGVVSKASLSKGVAGGCFGCLMGVWVLGLGIGAGATAEVRMSPEQRQEALQNAKVNSYPVVWQVCCLRRSP